MTLPEWAARYETRIRELEAELAKAWSEADKFANRAEEMVQENEILTRTVFSQSARAEKAEARVAELERRLDYLRRDPAVRTRELIGEQLGELEAREREADK